jgi:hypothetical protein
MNRKNSLLTTVAVAGVLFAGSTAVAANIGVLSQPGTSGDASAPASSQAAAPAVDPQIIDVYVEDPPVTAEMSTTTQPSRSQVFSVEAAGTVSVEPTATGVGLAGVTMAEGWQWTATQPAQGTLQVTFTSADTTYIFTAGLAADGSIVAGVDQPIVVPAPAAPSSSGNAPAARPPTPTPAPAPNHDEYEGGESDA